MSHESLHRTKHANLHGIKGVLMRDGAHWLYSRQRGWGWDQDKTAFWETWYKVQCLNNTQKVIILNKSTVKVRWVVLGQKVITLIDKIRQ